MQGFRALMIISSIGLAYACRALPPEQPQAVTLVFKHGKLFGNPEPLDRLLAQFEQETGVAVKREMLPAPSDEQHQFYAINLQGKSPKFDIFALDVIWVAEFAQAGWLRELTHMLPPQSKDEFFRGPIEAVTYQGRIYAMPWFIDAGLLYYRKDLLEAYGFEPPKSWRELVRIASLITAKHPGLYGFL